MKRNRSLTETENARKSLISFFFNLKNPSQTEVEDSKEYRTYTCLCKLTRRVLHKSGYSNLWSHIEKQHPDYQEQYNRYLDNKAIFFQVFSNHFCFLISQNAGVMNQTQLVSIKNQNLFEWLNLLVMEGLPFNIVESANLRQLAKLEPISVESFMKFMEEMTRNQILKQMKLFHTYIHTR